MHLNKYFYIYVLIFFWIFALKVPTAWTYEKVHEQFHKSVGGGGEVLPVLEET